MPTLAWRNDADGFAFTNSWTFDATERAVLTGLAESLVPAVVGAIAPLIPEPFVLSAIGTAAAVAAKYPAVGSLPTYGMCGGLAYAALDHWNTRVPIARGANATDQPARTAAAPSAIRNSIWGRLLDSLGPGGVLQRTLEWSLLLNQVPKEFGGGAGGLKNKTMAELDLLRGHLDAGTPWPIGLVMSNTDVWDQHQILIHGYKITGPDQATLYMYDNNAPFPFGHTKNDELTLDLRGPALVATPLFGKKPLAGFFCSKYVPSTPVGMSKAYGEFLTWTGDPRVWMVTDGARMPIASAAELSALGGSPATVRPTGVAITETTAARPRDGALFRERSSTNVVLYAGGAPFPIPDTVWLDRFGGAGRVRVVPDGTIAAFNGLPDEGTLLREWSDARVWRVMAGVRRWIRTPDELDNWGGFPSVRVVPDGALAGITIGQPLPVQPAPTWSWLNMGKPAGANLRALMGAVTVKDTPSAPQRPHVFIEANDYNLWCRYSTGASWAWTNMGKPPGVNINGFVGAVTVMDTPTSPQRAHVFVTGNDGSLWCRWSSVTAWQWSNMGKPQSANLRAPMGAVSVMDSPTSGQRPHVFIEGNDYNLWCYYFTGSNWAWTNMSKPTGANINGFVGAVTVMETPSSPQRTHLFVTGNDGNLWCRWSSGSAWQWSSMGKPASANIRGLMGAVTVMDSPTSGQRPHVFIEGNDYNLWCLSWTGSSWAWTNMSKPPGVNINGFVGAVTVMDAPSSPQRAHLFVTGNDGNLWCSRSGGAVWKWSNMGKPSTANIRGLMGAVSVMDTPTAPQRPHVFIEGNDYNLWCHWSS